MSHCHYHSISSVRKWGGEVGDYLPLHQWFDKSKEIVVIQRIQSPEQSTVNWTCLGF